MINYIKYYAWPLPKNFLDLKNLFYARLRLNRVAIVQAYPFPMTEDLSNTDISVLAIRRRRLMELEQTIFKSRTPTSIEILVFLAQNHFKAKLSAIYENTQATDASVRQHLRALERLNLIRQASDAEDGRAKSILMTEFGQQQMALYSVELASLLSKKI